MWVWVNCPASWQFLRFRHKLIGFLGLRASKNANLMDSGLGCKDFGLLGCSFFFPARRCQGVSRWSESFMVLICGFGPGGIIVLRVGSWL